MIAISSLSFSYGKAPIFRDLSLELPDPVAVLMGPSGCGKTTLLYLIAGLLKPDAGEIAGVAPPVSFLFQDDRLLPWFSARDNVAAVLPKEKKTAADEWLRRVELPEESFSSLPGHLSGGQRRRVALARALAYGDGLLILDEPFKGLDAELAERMIGLVLGTGRPLLVSTHSAEEARLLGGRILTLPPIRF
ncbi:MAG: ATP-binding cassette domain-containing protein [Clostridia bacterium]|nr:ATP-binding cassette domain-containing protein [Clostridia bacterium]